MKIAKPLGLMAFFIVVAALIANCDSSDGTPTAISTPLQTEPDFTGDIIEVHRIGETDVLGTILVEGTDVIQSSDKYVFTVKEETLIWEQTAKIIDPTSFEMLEAGQQTRIWFSGPVRESYPAQVDAQQIMLARE